MHPGLSPTSIYVNHDYPPSVGQITAVNDLAASEDDIRAAFEKMRAG
jgi:hypothetical protein